MKIFMDYKKFMIEDSDKESKTTTKQDLHWHLTLNSE